MNNENTICPVCNSQNAVFIRRISSWEPAKHLSLDQEQSEQLRILIESLWNGKESSYYLCKNCTLLYAVPFIPGNNKFYELAYPKSDNYPDWKWEFQITYEEIKAIEKGKKNFDSSSILLEIGAGKGAFVERISRDLLKKENIFCTEYSKSGQQSILDMGIECINTDILIVENPQFRNKFNYICLFQVLEHLSDFNTVFSTINYITVDEAVLFVGVPNDLLRNFCEQRGLSEDFPPIHITRWNLNSMSELANKFGWQLIDHKREQQSYLSKVNKYLHMLLMKKKYYFTLNKITNRNFKNLLKLIPFFYYIITNLLTIIELRDSKLGVVQWFKLTKTKSCGNYD
jgi:cyclopropane fatty-acyl-phospholipid synthase-like methyltransferase